MKITRALPVSLILSVWLGAHPMGNFSISHFSAIRIEASRVAVDYTLDFAEIPAGELLRGWGLDGAGAQAEVEQKAAGAMRGWGDGLQLSQAGRPLKLSLGKSEVVVTAGAGGLPVLRITGHFSAPVDRKSTRLNSSHG